MINKRIPADTQLKTLTFLNDKKIDGELYAYLQSISYANENKETVVYKNTLPPQAEICKILGIKSTTTLRTHINYLVEKNYLIKEKDKYILPNQEEIFFMIPLGTIRFLTDTMTEQVIKTYVYLGQRWKYKQNYVFTVKEISEHIGIKLNNNSRNYEIINNALDCLCNNGLLDYVNFYENGKPKKRLVKFSLTPKRKE